MIHATAVGQRALRAGPYVIGGTGGSGTRAFAAIVRQAGLYTGADLNVSEDALPLGDYSDRWIDEYLPYRENGPPSGLEQRMRTDLRQVLDRHLAALPPNAPWGWKEPRSIFLLPFLARELPALRFLHVVRDGRDMAFSANQNQLRKHGEAALDLDPSEPEPLRSIRLWAWINARAADYGERELRERYLRLRYEDLCEHPEETTARLLEFFALDGVPEVLAAEVRPPRDVPRWRDEDPLVVAGLEQAAATALARFGYSRDSASADPSVGERIASFPRWHYRFELAGNVTPVSDEQANRHEQRRRYLFDPLLNACGGSLAGKRVLDLGCNAGFWLLAALEERAHRVVGIDGRRMHIDQARLVLEAKGVSAARYELVEGDILEEDLGRWGTFDVVLCLGVLYHVDEPLRLFRRISAVADDLLLVDTAVSLLPGLAFELRDESPRDVRNALERRHVLWPTREALVELLTAHGYRAQVLAPDFDDYAGAVDYLAGRRLGVLGAKRTPIVSPAPAA